MFEGFKHLRVLVVVACLSGVAAAWADDACPGGAEIPLPAVCGVAGPSPRISCAIPRDVAPGIREGSALQRAFDVLGWQQFMALNWPAAPTGRGRPDASRPITAA